MGSESKLPLGWSVRRIEELGRVQAGRQRSPHFTKGIERPYLRVANVFDGYIDTSDVNTMFFTEKEYETYRLHAGDLLLNEGQSRELVGRCAMYQGNPPDSCFQNTIIRFRACDGFDSSFGHQLFRYYQRVGIFARIAKQTTSVAHLGVSRFASLSVRVPPIGEQRKIAAILSSVDEAIEKTQAVIDQVQVVKKGLMQELLTRGIPGRHTRFKQTEIGEVPADWDITTLAEAGEWFSGGTPVKSNSAFWGGDIPWVSPKDMKRLRLSDAIDHVTEAAIGDGTRIIPAGGLLVVVRGMILAHSFPSAITLVPVAFNQDIKALVVNSRFEPEFLLYWLRLRESAIVQQMATSTHGTKRLPTETLFGHPVPVPSQEEQASIARMLRAQDTYIEASQRKLESLRILKQALMSVLLTGELRVQPDTEAQ